MADHGKSNSRLATRGSNAKTTSVSSGASTSGRTTTYRTRNYSGTRTYSGTRNYSGTRYSSGGSRYYGRGGTSVFIGGGGFGYPYYGYGYYPYSYGYYPYGYSYGYDYYPSDYTYGYYSSRPAYGTNNGSIVVQVQTRLARAGYYHGAIDGAMGPRTSYAIRAYERDHGLRVDGAISGPLLRNMGLRY